MKIAVEELDFVLGQGSSIGWYDLRKLPTQAIQALPADQLEAWIRLNESLLLSRRIFSPQKSLIAFLDEIQTNNSLTETDVLASLSQTTGWDSSAVKFLIGAKGYNFDFPQSFQDERWILRLEQAFHLIRKAGVTASQIWQWNVTEPNSSLAQKIRNADKAQYDPQQWLDLAPKMSDSLRSRRRDALRDWLLANHIEFKDSEDLYSHFLIDPEVAPCFLTSRIKQAISSVQLFVQRILMGLEPGINFQEDEAAEWEWRKNYRVWEANRKVLLYPESYIMPELRDDKSPFFRELENSLLQEEVTDDSVERAYEKYLRSLDEVAQLEIVGLYVDEDEDVVHIFACTKGNPPAYFYRRWVDQSYYTAWEKVNVKVDGKHVLPVVYNRRLMLIWMTFQEKAKPDIPKKRKGAQPSKYWEIQLNWSEYQDGGWSSVKTSSNVIKEVTLGNYPQKSVFYFYSEIKNNKLSIVPFYRNYFFKGSGFEPPSGRTVSGNAMVSDKVNGIDLNPNFMFLLDGSREDFRVVKINPNDDSRGIRTSIPYLVAYFDPNEYSYMKFGTSSGKVSMFSKVRVGQRNGNIDLYNSIIETIMNGSPKKIFITPPHQFPHFSSQSPFFLEHDRRSFFVIPFDHYGAGGNSNAGIGQNRHLVLDKNSMSPEKSLGLKTTLAPSKGLADASDSLSQGTMQMASTAAKPVYYSLRDKSKIIDRSKITKESPDLSVFGIATNKLETFVGLNSEQANLDFKPNVPHYKQYRFQTFYHPYVGKFIEQLNVLGVEGLLNPDKNSGIYRQKTTDQLNFSGKYGYGTKIYVPRPIEEIEFAYGGAYSQYNWELFFHIPMMIANRLSENQQFEEARRWYEFIFNPRETNTEGLKPDELHRRFWKIKPFYEFSGESTIEAIAKLINKGDDEYENQIERWEEDPFNPHLIARLRPAAYMKYVIMKYIDNLLAQADNLYSQDNLESINEAVQLYMLAAEMLGRKPERVGARTPDARTYQEIRPLLDDLSNALVTFEDELQSNPKNKFIGRAGVLSRFKMGSGTTLRGLKTRKMGGGAASLAKTLVHQGKPKGETGAKASPKSLYYCLLPNDKLLSYWDIVQDRLFKIRNCMNIEGTTRSLDLFSPPINPALLVKARAAGLNLSSVLNDLNAPMPYYRFSYLVQRALDFCNDVKNLGGVLLATLEKKDAEEMALLRAGHEVNMLEAVRQIKEKAIDEAKESITALEESKKLIQFRGNYYRNKQYADSTIKCNGRVAG